MNPSTQTNMTTFINQMALVVGAQDIVNLPPSLESTFRPACGSFTRDLDDHMPSDPLLCANYGLQIGNNIVAEATKHENKLDTLKVVHTFVNALETTFIEFRTWKVEGVQRAVMEEEEKRALRERWEAWGVRMMVVCREICARLLSEVELLDKTFNPQATLDTPNGADFKAMTTEPLSHVQPYASIPSPLKHANEEDHNTLPHSQPQRSAPIQNYGYNIDGATTNTAVNISRSARTSVSSLATNRADDRIFPSGRGGRSRHFTEAQNKKIILWMKQNKAWSIQHHQDKYEQLLQDVVFDDVRGESESDGSKLRKRLRDKMDKLRGQLLKEGAAKKVTQTILVVKSATLTKSTQRNELVFEDWTDAWLENGWDGNITKSAM